MIMRMFKELRRGLNEHSEKFEVFNKELKNIKNNQAEMKNRIAEMKKYSRRN